MDTGVAIFPTHDAMDPASLARLVEERGHESLFFPEHTHIPASRQSPYPGGAELPRKYAHTYDLFVAMTAAAVATTKLRVGSGICLVIERDPIVTAKEVASIDALSGGRVEFGVGAGWNREEMANHGTDPRRRMEILRERVEAMKAIWTEDEASYHGRYVDFDRIWSWPKPAQRPHPPVLVGGNGPTVLDRVLAFGDAWMPNYTPEGLLERAEELTGRAERRIELMVMGVPADPRALEPFSDAGFRRALHWLPSGARRRGGARARSLRGGGGRAARGMTPEEARHRFAATRVARLATADASGRPHVVPFVFAVCGDTIYSAVDHKPKRSGALRRLANVAVNPAVSALVDEYDDGDWSRLWWARAEGHAAIHEPGSPEAVRGVEALRGRYAQYLEQPPAGAVLAISVERWSGWEASGTISRG